MNDHDKGFLLGLLGVFSFGLTLPATRLAVPWMHPVFIGLGRAAVAAILAGLILWLTRQPLPEKGQWRQLLIVSLGVVIGFPVLSAWSMQTLPASHGGVILGSLPLLTVVAGVFVTHERPSTGFWVSSVFGCALVVTYSLYSASGTATSASLAGADVLFADFVLFVAVVSAAIGYAVGGQLARSLGGWQVICWALLIALPFILWPAWSMRPDNLGALPISALGGFIYLALISQLFGFFFWYRGLALGGVARVSQTQLLQPFVTILASALLLAEAITPATWFFAVAVVLTVAISKRMKVHT